MPSTKPLNRILLVEDEPKIADTLIYALGSEGYEVEWQQTGQGALAVIRSNIYDLTLLDVGLPDMDGFEVCRQIRALSNIPILFLTARNDEIDRILGLELGADDYVTKPFSPREVCARVRANLRRVAASPVTQPTLPTGFEHEPEKRLIRYCGNTLSLSKHEYQILKVLLTHPDHVYSREQLLQMAWAHPDHSTERTVDSHIKNLRAKLRAAGEDPIRTHRGVGYSLSR